MSTHEHQKQPMSSPGRTQGDGMENITEPSIETANYKREKNSLGNTLIYHPSDLKQFSSTPPVITGKIVNLVPKHFTQTKKDTVLIGSLKGKEPKFVPYEPYKAAVKPIIPFEKKSKSGERKLSRKSADLKILVSPVSNPLEDASLDKIEGEQDDSVNAWKIERKMMEEELRTLKEENGQLESQLKFQAQVNAELKTLLVAAVGEDLETRVHLLTEDKLQLARALLNSAQRLSTHQEQTEWLAGQCEVWRSKFLASSLMVEELAKWKAALCQKATELQETVKRLLEERMEVRTTLLSTYKNLCTLRENFDHTRLVHSPSRKCDLASTNIIDVAGSNLHLSEVLHLQLLGTSHQRFTREPDFTGLEMSTIAEKTAENLLLNPNPLLLSGRPDAACSAVMGAAVAVGGLGISPLLMSSCAHCSGEVKLV